MDKADLEFIRNCPEKMWAIEFLVDTCDALRQEVSSLLAPIKLENKDFVMDFLEEAIEYHKCQLALLTKYTLRKSKAALTPEQALLYGMLNYSISDLEKVKSETSCEAS